MKKPEANEPYNEKFFINISRSLCKSKDFSFAWKCKFASVVMTRYNRFGYTCMDIIEYSSSSRLASEIGQLANPLWDAHVMYMNGLEYFSMPEYCHQVRE